MESNWRKSSYSADNGGACVEVAAAEAVLVRDTTDRSGPVVTFTADTWRAFTSTISTVTVRLPSSDLGHLGLPRGAHFHAQTRRPICQT